MEITLIFSKQGTVSQSGNNKMNKIENKILLPDWVTVFLFRQMLPVLTSVLCCNIFIKYLENQLHKVKRIKIVWDVYKSNSPKCTTRSEHGKGV